MSYVVTILNADNTSTIESSHASKKSAHARGKVLRLEGKPAFVYASAHFDDRELARELHASRCQVSKLQVRPVDPTREMLHFRDGGEARPVDVDGKRIIVRRDGSEFTAWVPAFGGDPRRELRHFRDGWNVKIYQRVGSESFPSQPNAAELVRAREELAIRAIVAAFGNLPEHAVSEGGRVTISL